MNNTKYKLDISEPVTQSWLEANHFFWNRAQDMFIHRFNVWRITETESAYGEFRLSPGTYDVEFDVYISPKNYFGMYYQGKWGLLEEDDHLEFETMLRRIQSEMDRFGIVENSDKSLPIPILEHKGRRES